MEVYMKLMSVQIFIEPDKWAAIKRISKERNMLTRGIVKEMLDEYLVKFQDKGRKKNGK
jgi:hypothetical protein